MTIEPKPEFASPWTEAPEPSPQAIAQAIARAQRIHEGARKAGLEAATVQSRLKGQGQG